MSSSHSILLTPWRMDYILSSKDKHCIFCDKAPFMSVERDREEGVLYRTPLAYVIMNLYPYNNGHIMISPARHVGTFAGLEPEELRAMAALLGPSERILNEVLHTQGINIGANIGEASGAGFADHLHIHLVPRWSGDTNFMAVVNSTRILPESVQGTYERLLPHFQGLKL